MKREPKNGRCCILCLILSEHRGKSYEKCCKQTAAQAISRFDRPFAKKKNGPPIGARRFFWLFIAGAEFAGVFGFIAFDVADRVPREEYLDFVGPDFKSDHIGFDLINRAVDAADCSDPVAGFEAVQHFLDLFLLFPLRHEDAENEEQDQYRRQSKLHERIGCIGIHIIFHPFCFIGTLKALNKLIAF